MRRIRISIAALMGVVAAVAVIVFALKNPNDRFDTLAVNLALLTLATTTVVGLIGFRRGKYVWFGFALFAWAYFAFRGLHHGWAGYPPLKIEPEYILLEHATDILLDDSTNLHMVNLVIPHYGRMAHLVSALVWSLVGALLGYIMEVRDARRCA